MIPVLHSQSKRIKINPTKLFVDLALTVLLLGLWSIALTGLVLHEWLGIALIGVLLVHLSFNWSWIVATTRRFLRALRTQVRINYLLNVALFVAMTTVLFTGLMISVVALPAFGLHTGRSMFLTMVHVISGDLLLVVVGLHLGMNWRWVVTTVRRQLHLHLPRRALPPLGVPPARAVTKGKMN